MTPVGKPQQAWLFPALGKGRRPAPPEFSKHCVIVDIVRLFLSPGWEWTHLPFGEKRSLETARRLKRMGVNPGWPDFLFVSPSGVHHYVELKRAATSALNDNQRRIARFLKGGGVAYLKSASIDEICRQLLEWGVLRQDARW